MVGNGLLTTSSYVSPAPTRRAARECCVSLGGPRAGPECYIGRLPLTIALDAPLKLYNAHDDVGAITMAKSQVGGAFREADDGKILSARVTLSDAASTLR